MNKKITLIASFLGLYLISAGISLLVFTYVLGKPGQKGEEAGKNVPLMVQCSQVKKRKFGKRGVRL